MYKHTLKVHGQYLAQAQPLPAGAGEDGNGATLKLSGDLGGQEVAVEAASAVTLAAGKALTVTLKHSDNGAEWEELGAVKAGAGEYPAGDILARFVIPTNCRKLVKAHLATDDAAASGSVHVYPHYLAR
jgi:hypothetical protein